MKTLVLGGTGFLSGALVRHLLREGHAVTIVTRGTIPPDPACESIAADRSDATVLAAAVAGRRFDAVYDMIAYEPEASKAAARIFRGSIGRFIHCSTISVYMVSRDVQCPITEDQAHAPLMEHWPRNPFGMDYGIKKRQCEETLWNHHDSRLFPVSILRPTFISGPADPAKRDWFWIKRLLDGRPLLIPGSGDYAFQQAYVDDVARMFVRLLTCPESIGKAYNVAAEEVFSFREYLDMLSALLGRKPACAHLRQEEFDRLPISSSHEGDVFPFNVRRTAVFSLDQIKQDLGYRSTPWKVWMQETIRWWSAPGRGDGYGWSNREEEVRIATQLLDTKVTG
ncbi:MAG: NAD-dependent epimerase/dehydratase family protein [Bacteroidetes bacterium]|nr:NAD-dependent epimerase/dehydratase family protein [Bacteroidota bacterium]